MSFAVSFDLLVPYGETFGDKRLVPPSLASKDQAYKCPCCGSILVLKKGDVKTPHFAHPVRSGCSFETILHSSAKKLLYNLLLTGFPPTFMGVCSSPLCDNLVSLPEVEVQFSTVLLETHLTKPNQRIRPDIHLRDYDPVFAFEVYVSHELSSLNVASYPIPWLEFEAAPFLENPTQIVARRTSFEVQECALCASKAASKKLPVISSLGPTLPPEPGTRTHIRPTTSTHSLLCVNYYIQHATFEGCPGRCFWCVGQNRRRLN